MKNLQKFLITGFISLLICFSLFFSAMSPIVFSQQANTKTVQKTDSSVPYYPTLISKSCGILLRIDECPVIFLVKFLPEKKTLSIGCMPEKIINSEGKKLIAFENESGISVLGYEKYNKTISFTLSGFENMINYLNGIEIETPYGLPAPAKNNTILARGEKMKVYGASLGIILTEAKQPSSERLAYYCYVIGELCLEFLKECTTESYKFLNQNSKTDISYTDFYDNYEGYKSSINNAVCDSPVGSWEDGWFYIN